MTTIVVVLLVVDDFISFNRDEHQLEIPIINNLTIDRQFTPLIRGSKGNINFVFSSIYFHLKATIDFTSFGEPIYIEDYAWLATRVMLLDGARIGRGAVLGAGTICSKPIEPYKIVSGNSAKPVGERPRDIEYTGVGGRNLYNFLH